jgi:hypothetical protein
MAKREQTHRINGKIWRNSWVKLEAINAAGKRIILKCIL